MLLFNNDRYFPICVTGGVRTVCRGGGGSGASYCQEAGAGRTTARPGGADRGGGGEVQRPPAG